MKYLLPLLLIISIVSISGCVQNTTGNTTTNSTVPVEYRTVVNGDQIAVDYIGSFENGTVFDSSVGQTPLEFTVGAGQMIKGFNAAVIGMKVGEEKTVAIKPEDAYGPVDPTNVIQIPLANVPNITKVGDTLYSSNGQPAVVLEIRNNTVVLDVNHPMAGKTLDSMLYAFVGIAIFLAVLGAYLLVHKVQKNIIVKKIIQKKEEKKAEAPKTLSPEYKQIFNIISQAGGTILQGEIVTKSNMDKVKVSRILDKLEMQGLVERRRHGMSNLVVLKK
ncbi:MAG: FKBP-type peptidyl-prolyl cis-trans isomerase [Candidatus Aenigmarchaeota archaeon]|nr:FKBP-type peptidyl-prolyl cis-trans isomerase [Candidatus Aenigmarchaeota archaeon]